MNNVLEEVKDLKELILLSDEYKDYRKYLDLVEKDKDINNLINQIVLLQKDIVNLNFKEIDTNNKELELDELYTKLNNIDKYNKYIESSKKLNILITDIQNRFNIYFDSLVE